MRIRIHRSFFFVGIVSVILTFLLSGILYYQGMQERAIHEIAHLTEVASDGLTGNRASDLAFLEKIREKSIRPMRISWIAKDGSVILETKSIKTADYENTKEIREAKAEGRGEATRKNEEDQPVFYAARLLADGSILRLSVPRTAPAGILSPLIPEIFLFFIAICAICYIVAQRSTESVLEPLRRVEDLISDIMAGVPEREMPGGYKELRPLVDKVREQKAEIQNYTEDLEEERNTIRTVVDTITDGILLLNEEKEIIDSNPMAMRIFGYTDPIRYRKIAGIYHDEDFLRAVELAYEKGGRQSYTMNISQAPYRVSFVSIELSDDETGLLIVLHDMSLTYAAEKMRREFSANVSHELKTPLTSISGFAEMIAGGLVQNEADAKMFAGRILDESHRMLGLIETIMHLSRVEEGQTTITWKPVDMKGAAEYTADIIAPQAASKNVTIRVEAEPVFVYGNQSLLYELVMNCIDNAVKYNKDGGEVTVSLHKDEEGNAVLVVADTGIGIPKDKQERVFERFYRVDESRNKATGGSGLGLAICKHIVTQHHGNIEIESTEGEGTRIIITLPVMTDEELAREAAATTAAQLDAIRAEQGEFDEAPDMAETEIAEEISDAETEGNISSGSEKKEKEKKEKKKDGKEKKRDKKSKKK